MICVCESCKKEFRRQRGSKGRFCGRKCWGAAMRANNPSKLSLPADFWASVEKAGDDECWLWSGARTTQGYGQVTYRRKAWLAHRLSFFLVNNHSPECVLHSCDNPPCCNPAHLFKGDRIINNADRHAKGRSRGGSNAGAKNGMYGKRRLEIVR